MVVCGKENTETFVAEKIMQRQRNVREEEEVENAEIIHTLTHTKRTGDHAILRAPVCATADQPISAEGRLKTQQKIVC